MKHPKLLRLACAACLLCCAATFIKASVAKTAAPRPCILLRGKQLATLAGYELNASFTPDGRFYRFEIGKQ